MRNLTLVLGATTLAGMITSTILWQQLHAARQDALQLQHQLMDREAGATWPGHLIADSRIGNELQVQPGPAADTAASRVPDMAPTPAPPVDGERTRVISSTELVKDPLIRQSMAASIRATQPQQHPWLAEELNLTPEQQDKLFDQLTANHLELLGAGPGANADADERSQAADRREALTRKHEAALASLLGATTYDQWKDYRDTVGVRQQVRQLETTLQSGSQPLTETRRRQLTAALVDFQKQLNMSARQEPGNVVAVTPADKTALVEARLQSRQEQDRMLRDVAAPYLSPEQLDAFAAQQEQASALTLAMLRAGSGQGSRPALRPE